MRVLEPRRMVPEKYGLAAIGRFLIDQFELRRPGLNAWTPEIAASLRAQAETELLQMERQLKELGVDDAVYWQRVRGALSDILLPRYAKLATAELEQAKDSYGLWRNGDLVSRGAYALAGFAIGIVCVEVPYIPVQVRWFPSLTLVAGPMIPDAWLWWKRRQYRKSLEALVKDLDRANENLETYRPLSELTRILEMPANLAEAPATSAAETGKGLEDRARERERS